MRRQFLFKSKSLAAATLTVLVCGALSAPASGMQEKEAPPEKVGEPVKEVIEKVVEQAEEVAEDVVVGQAMMIGQPSAPLGKILGAFQFQLNQAFGVEIEKLDRICQLSAGQKSKLTVGAKGVVKKLVEEKRQDPTFREMFGMFAGGPFADEDTKETDDSGEIVVEEIQKVDDLESYIWQVLEMGNGPNEMMARPTPIEHAQWRSLVRGTLTEEQQTSLATHNQQEEQKLRQLNVAAGVQQLVVQLGLTDEQVQALTPLTESRLDRFRRMPTLYRSFAFNLAVASIPGKELEKILSPAQYHQLQISLSPMREMLSMMESELEDQEPVGGDDEAKPTTPAEPDQDKQP